MRTGDFLVQLEYAAESSLFCILQNARQLTVVARFRSIGRFQRTSQLGESACHMPLSYRFIFLETSAAGLPGNYLYRNLQVGSRHFAYRQLSNQMSKYYAVQQTKYYH